MQIKLNKFQKFTMSYWLQARISEVGSRDIIDMYNDILRLKELLEECMEGSASCFNTITHVEIDEFEARAATEFAKCKP